MRYRQIHLDFHTAGEIPGIGSRFDPDDFAETFVKSKVNSVNLFAKCHHGYSYHPTEVGEMHPHLDFDLLRAQVDALQARGIETPIYVSAVWDELSVRQHPEWRIVSPDNSHPVQKGDIVDNGWKFLDLSSPYLDHLVAQVEEVVTLFPEMNGVWMDICFQKPSISEFAKAGMEKDGLDWTDPEHRAQFAELTTFRFFERVTDIAKRAGKPVFYNLGHIRRGRDDVLRKYFSHLEIESLPTGQWGYEHFPVSARYFEPTGMDYLGMTGKFHHMWGEMGGYKKPDALVYECGAMIAQGAKCCIGDHLRPDGHMDKSTYRAIGEAYSYLETCEPWAQGSTNRAEIGVVSQQAVEQPKFSDMPGHHNHVDDGVVRLLLEGRFTFDLLSLESDLSPYRLIILPDVIAVDDALKAKIDAYLANGGRLLMTGESGLRDGEFLFDAGAQWHGVSPFEGGDYALPRQDLRSDFVDDPLFMYAPSQQIKATDGESLGVIHDPYFDRAGALFSGHLHTPDKPEPNGYALGTKKGAVTYLAHPIFSIYYQAGPVALAEIVFKAIRLALGQKAMIDATMPMAGRATLRRQATEGRDVLHLLYVNPVRRGTLRDDPVQPIQDIVPLPDVAVDVEAPGDVSSVRLVPQGSAIDFVRDGDRVRFTVPEVRGHQMIEIA